MNHWRLAKNALANLGRGSAAAVVALVLPPILVRHMQPATYAVWILILQTAAYVSFLDLGLQTAIGRFVAYANEKQDKALRDSIFSTAFAALCGAALLALSGLVAVVVLVPVLFPGIPSTLISQMRLALLIVGGAMALELPSSAWSGVFVGLQRYEIPALTIGSARLFWAIGVTIAALSGRSIVVMASVIAGANLLSSLARYLCMRRFAPELHFKFSQIQRSRARELASYCFGLTVMSFSMLLVSGFDLLLVGHFQFSAVTPYSVAASMITFISGLLFAVMNVLMPHAATLHASEKAREMGNLVVTSTRLSTTLLILTAAPIFIYAGPIIQLWIGQRYVAAGTPLLHVLILANVIRLIGAAYSVVLIGAGQQSYIKISPLAEGISNFAASLVLGYFFGAMGVAVGTLLGSVVSIAAHLVYSMVRTRRVIDFSRKRLVVSGIGVPLLITSPLFCVAGVSLLKIPAPGYLTATAMLLSIVAAGILLPQSSALLMKRFRTYTAADRSQ